MENLKHWVFVSTLSVAFTFTSPVMATDFVFAPAPVTGDLIEPGQDSGNARFTYLSVDSNTTSITGFGGSLTMRNRLKEGYGFNMAGNMLIMEDDAGTLSATSVNLMAGPDFYLGNNFIVFLDGSLGSTSADVDTPFGSSSSSSSLTGFSYGFQVNLGASDGVKFTPYFMGIEQTVSSDGGPDVDVSSSVVGLDILINNISLAAMFQSSDDTDITMFSIGAKF